MAEHLLDIHNLSVCYPDIQLLSGLSFSVDRGQIVCVCGESGCGKTSLLNAIIGFADSEGTVSIDGNLLNADSVDLLRKQVAYVPQELSLPHETVREMVRVPFMLKANRHIPFSEEALLNEWKFLNLSESLLDKRVSEISGGQRQRIMLSVAGLLQKPLLLVDEPTSALDVDSAMLVLDYFRMLASERQMGILVVSHHKDFASGCDTIINLSK